MDWNALLTQHPHVLLYSGIAVALFLIFVIARAVSTRRAQESYSLNPADSARITPINEVSAARCTHCGVGMSARQDFCPSCGYAQPVRQPSTARFVG